MYKLLLRVCEVQLPSIVWFRQIYCSICCNKKLITPCWEWPRISWYLTLYAVSVVLFSDTLFSFFGNVDSHTSGNVQVLVIAFIYEEGFANAIPLFSKFQLCGGCHKFLWRFIFVLISSCFIRIILCEGVDRLVVESR